MSGEKWTNEEVLDLIGNEGLGYAIYGYLGKQGNLFEDTHLGELWDDAYDALTLLKSYLDTLETE